jgi:transposase
LTTNLGIEPQRRRTAVERYLGADVHAASVTFSVLNQSGKQLRRDVVETNGRALVGYLQQIPGNRHLCFEEGEWSQWLYEILSPHVAEIVVYRGEWKPGVKNDAIDAHGLAEKLRTGKIGRPVYKDARRFTALREQARTYTMVTRDVARVKSRIKSFYRARGVPCSGEGVYKPAGREKRARELPVATRQAVSLLGQELDGLVALKAEAEAAMLRESHRHRISRILETAPGFGPVRVAQMLPIVITPGRFRTKRQFWSYCGFGVVTRSSSDWIWDRGRWVKARVLQTRGLNFNHNRMRKAIFKGAATTVIVHSGPNPLREDYDRLLENGTKPNLAKLTVARKIAAIVLAMWKAEEKYNPGKYRPTH